MRFRAFLAEGLRPYRDALIHLGVALGILFAAWSAIRAGASPTLVVADLVALAFFFREQAQVGMRFKLWAEGQMSGLRRPPRPWAFWEWSLKTHVEWALPAAIVLGIGYLAG